MLPLLPEGRGLVVEPVLPRGRSLAQRTSNAAFGVVDGLADWNPGGGTAERSTEQLQQVLTEPGPWRPMRSSADP